MTCMARGKKKEWGVQVTETWASNDILGVNFSESNFIPVFILWEISVT